MRLEEEELQGERWERWGGERQRGDRATAASEGGAGGGCQGEAE